MIEVTIGTNTHREKIIVDPGRTLRSVLEEQGVDYSIADLHLDGVSLEHGDLNKTFTELGVTDKCYLISVVKLDNA